MDMNWQEFCNLISGLMHDTPLGQIVAVRAETNKTTIKNFTKSQRKIYNDWRKKIANDKLKDGKSYEQQMLDLEKYLQLKFG